MIETQENQLQEKPFLRQQEELPFALINGEAMIEPPKDLYIPPDALEIILDAFEGPFDLLLYLIKKQNLEILEISVAEITQQYMSYVDFMKNIKLELAAEYLVMAAMLAEIKSRMLLPRHDESTDEDDPRAELIRRLQLYETFKKAAEDIDELSRVDRDIFLTEVEVPTSNVVKLVPKVQMKEILLAFQEVMARAELYSHHSIIMEPLSVRERMTIVLDKINESNFTPFSDFFKPEEGKRGVVVTLLAILELIKEALIEIAQSEAYAPIYIKAPEHDRIQSAD